MFWGMFCHRVCFVGVCFCHRVCFVPGYVLTRVCFVPGYVLTRVCFERIPFDRVCFDQGMVCMCSGPWRLID